ncbi:MAG: FAD:protein FMN transferase [Candidatus Peribacteria bacterium]|nr:MAG: FAD:protein FMN transferase [Candidatus Peribacteria bacterium]
MASFSLEALGSVLHIQTPTEIRDVLKTSLISKISDFEQKYSRFISNNYLAQLNASGEGNIDNEFLLLFDACFQAYHNSLGHFDITLLPLLENMGYGVALQKMEEKIGMDHIKVQ